MKKGEQGRENATINAEELTSLPNAMRNVDRGSGGRAGVGQTKS